MKTKILFRIYRYMGLFILSFLLCPYVQAYSGKDPRNGEEHPTKGTIRTLVVFAEVTGDPNYNLSTWPWEAGKMPSNAGELFDVNLLTFGGGVVGPAYGPISPTVPVRPTKKITGFYYDASFGDLVLLGDYYPELVQIPYSLIESNGNYHQAVMNKLAEKPDLKSKTGLRIPEDFDHWTPTGPYLEKNKQPDGKIDNLIIVWRVNTRLSSINGRGWQVGGISSSDGRLQSNITQYMRLYDFLESVILPHEFSHTLLGGNEYHNGAANAGKRHFMTDVGGYSLLEGYGCNLRSCNAWDRRRLGWKYADNLPEIHARSTDNKDVNGDVAYRKPTASELQSNLSPTTQTYVLRDFMTTGDALRIQLPYLEQGGESVEPQWLWLENHAKDTGLLYYDNSHPCPLGVRINLQVGSDYYGCFMRTNYYVPLSRFGRWDFNIVRSIVNQAGSQSVVNLPYIPELDTNRNADYDYEPTTSIYRAYTTSDKSNAFTGNSLLEKLNFDANTDGKLQDKEVFMMKYVYKDNVRVGGDYPHMGNTYDAFQVGDVLSMGTNPATTPWLTHASETGEDLCTPINTTYDNRKIYLNGLKIAITGKRADGSVVVEVTQGYYTIDKNQRWCGDIVSNEKISLNAGRRINLALGETPVVKTNPIVIDGKRYYTEPTVLTCKSQSVLSLGTNSRIEVDSLCALVLSKGSILEKRESSGTAVIQIKRGGTLIVEPGATLKGTGIRFILEEGSYACINGSYVTTSNCQSNGANRGIHPYVQGNKNLKCRSLVSTFGAPKTGGDTAQVYQSFFEGNPVYNQVGMNMMACGYYIPIYRQSLGEDTVVDGILYHKLSVLKEYGDWRDEKDYVQVWVRESEAHDKVWVRLPWDVGGQEFLVVDMGLDQGDAFVMDRKSESITLCDTTWDPDGAMIVRYKDTVVFKETCYVVDSVYYLEHPGGVLKHIRLSPQGYNGYTEALEMAWTEQCDWQSHHLEFIEGVGSNLGFVYRRLGVSYRDSLWGCLSWRSYEAPTDYIICMERDNAVYYEHPNAECKDCDATVFFHGGGANERVESMSRYLRLSPNPAREEVSLQWTAESPVDGACRITLYDMQGVRLRSYTADCWPYTLRVSGLPSGTYVLRVEPEDASATWQATVRLTRL